MADENSIPDREQNAGSNASEVIAEALSSMREDETARTLADALAGAWGSGKFDVEAALREIASRAEGEQE